MTARVIVDRNEWLEARIALLEKEKDFTKAREVLAAERRQMPWVKVEAGYAFNGADGKETLGDLFGGKSQLIVQHFMLGDGWEAGCPSCSFWADGYEGIDVHLAKRDIAFVTISNAPLDVSGASAYDLAPTVLDLLGLPIGDGYDGKPLPLKTGGAAT